jgi:glucokinase
VSHGAATSALESDERVVLTLDAGGTNLVFSAIRGAREVVPPLRLPSHAADLDQCLATLVEGFDRVRRRAEAPPAAISFAFPGPADYAAGIIGDCNNFPAFRGGVPLGPMLEDRFSLPVFINNDGDLFTFGETRYPERHDGNRRGRTISSSGVSPNFNTNWASATRLRTQYSTARTVFLKSIAATSSPVHSSDGARYLEVIAL